MNLYGFVGNDGLGKFDYLGYADWKRTGETRDGGIKRILGKKIFKDIEQARKTEGGCCFEYEFYVTYETLEVEKIRLHKEILDLPFDDVQAGCLIAGGACAVGCGIMACVPEPGLSKACCIFLGAAGGICMTAAGCCEVCELITGGDQTREIEELYIDKYTYEIGRIEIGKKKISDYPCKTFL